MRSNKKLIIVISIVCVLAVASAVGAYLFLMTDIFKSNNLLDKVYCESVEEKYRTKAPKENNAINYSLVKLEN